MSAEGPNPRVNLQKYTGRGRGITDVRSSYRGQRHLLNAALARTLQLASLFAFCVQAIGAVTSVNEVVGQVDVQPDDDTLQMQKIMKEDSAANQAAGWQQPPGVMPHSSDPSTAGEEDMSTDTDDDSDLELITSAKILTDQVPVPKKAREVSLVQTGSMDGTMGIVRTRLASEEQFSLRLQKLVAQSALESHKKQEKLVLLQEQLQNAAQEQIRLRGASMKRAAELEDERTYAAIQHSRADKAEAQLQQASHAIAHEEKTVEWLSEQVKTLTWHLSHVTHIDKELQRQLAAANTSLAKSRESMAAEKRKESEEDRSMKKLQAELLELRAGKTTELQATTEQFFKQNDLLQQRMLSVSKRDNILGKENDLLRQQLHSETAQAQQAQTEMEEMKAAFSDMQKKNFQLQNKYAESLKALIVARAGADTAARGGIA